MTPEPERVEIRTLDRDRYAGRDPRGYCWPCADEFHEVNHSATWGGICVGCACPVVVTS